MASPRGSSVAPSASTPDMAALRADLTAAHYTVDHLADLLGPAAGAALHREQVTPARRVLAGSDDPVAVLVRLFTLGEAVDAASLERAMPTLGVAGLQRIGLVEPAPATPDDGTWLATCDLRPYSDDTHDWWLASDLSEIATRASLPEDHVLGVGGASTTLAS